MAGSTKKFTLIGLFSLLFIIVWQNSFVGTTDIANWCIENTLTVISLLFLVLTFKRYRFSNFSYFVIFTNHGKPLRKWSIWNYWMVGSRYFLCRTGCFLFRYARRCLGLPKRYGYGFSGINYSFFYFLCLL